ncbi:hypothetical protein VKT23_015985 [Stygiomarasmius scandens]|uniref:Uncharacterized protein n=1 Tax=Marasmiellus scandens TaxID=2682957 RepID=A0ABR1IW97_9AGAR
MKEPSSPPNSSGTVYTKKPKPTSESLGLRGRGIFHLRVLFEQMRREVLEFAIGPPKAVPKPDPEFVEKGGAPNERQYLDQPQYRLRGLVLWLGESSMFSVHPYPALSIQVKLFLTAGFVQNHQNP